jgi:hypothetical protein
MTKKMLYTALLTGLLLSTTARAEDYAINIQDHQFTPAQLIIPARQKVKIAIKNSNAKKFYFYSYDLNRNKLILPQETATIFIGPLEAGTYTYYDHHSPQAGKGEIVVK